MKDYLQGYLDVIPQSEKLKIQETLKSNQVVVGKNVTENEFAQLIKQIMESHKQFTKAVPQTERMNSQAYNQFFSNAQVDLDLMFTESDLIDRALGSYDRLYDGIIVDLNNEIKALRERINSLRLVAEGENGLIVKSFDFSTTGAMETDRERYAHLFRDRDGSIVSDIVIERNSDQSYMCLGKQTQDRIRDESGRTVATLQVIDQRGMPISQNQYPIINAVDDSRDSYWGEVILSDQPINIALDSYQGNGAMVKFTLTLPRPEVVSEIVLSPFTTYPLEIVSIKYEEDIETYHVPKEILKVKTESVQTMVIQFPKIIARRLTFVLRQKNYTKNNYLVREAEMAKVDLWNKISKRETSVSLGTPSNTNVTVNQTELDTYSGWDIYLSEVAKNEREITAWTQKLQAYQLWLAQTQTYRKEYQAYVDQINELNRQYKAGFIADPSAI